MTAQLTVKRACRNTGRGGFDNVGGKRRSCAALIELTTELMDALPAENAFERLLNMEGKVHREVANRRTVEFELGGRRYFVKAQRGCGWGEIIKNLAYGRAPVVSARTEWKAIEATARAGVPTLHVVGKGTRGFNPARLHSFVVTEALEGMISLEQLVLRWQSLPAKQRVRLKRALLQCVALVARRLHQAGLNHRDFYLCHFLVHDCDWDAWSPAQPLELILIDLHRMQQRERVPNRWLVKDLGGLLFSAFDAGLTSRDVLRFLAIYRGQPWREVLAREGKLVRDVWKNAVALYRPFHRREPPLRMGRNGGSPSRPH